MSNQQQLAIRQKPGHLAMPKHADPEYVAKLMDAVDTQSGEDRLLLLLAFQAMTWKSLADNAPGPAQRTVCHSQLAVIQNLVPARIWALLDRARKQAATPTAESMEAKP